MKKIKFLILVVVFGCELEVEVEQPPFEPSMVLSCIIDPDETILAILSPDQSILTPSFLLPNPITNATVTLYENGVLVGEMDEVINYIDINGQSIDGVYQIDYQARPGNTYEVRAEKIGFEPISAVDVVPTSIEQVSLECNDCNSNGQAKVNVTLIDEPGDDYYEIKLFIAHDAHEYYFDELTGEVVITNTYETRFSTYSRTESLLISEHNYDRIIFEDNLFENSSQSISLETDLYINYGIVAPDEDPNARLILEMRKVSRSYYEYFNSIALQNWIDGDPFAEPVQIFSNVENGKGFLGSYSSRSIEIEL